MGIELNRIIDQLNRAFNGKAWHGTPLMVILAGINAKVARKIFLPGTHSIWELVLHITAWQKFARVSIEGGTLPAELPADVDWPEVTSVSGAGWQKTLRQLQQEHDLLLNTIKKMSDGDLELKVKGRNYSIYVLLHGVVQHNLYHAGQIALLRVASEREIK